MYSQDLHRYRPSQCAAHTRCMEFEQHPAGGQQRRPYDERVAALDEREQRLQQWQELLEQSLKAADEREQRLQQWHEVLEQRDQAADEREELANRREQAADNREKEANQREQSADDREAQATRRDHRANQRDHELDELERLIGRTRSAGASTSTLRQRAEEAVIRSRERVEISMAHLESSKDALQRLAERKDREQQMVERRIASAERLTRKAQSDGRKAEVSHPPRTSSSTTGLRAATRPRTVPARGRSAGQHVHRRCGGGRRELRPSTVIDRLWG